MMVWKYLLKDYLTDKTELELPIGSEILTCSIDEYSGKPAIWALVPSDEEYIGTETHTITIVGTGTELPYGFDGKYLNTYKSNNNLTVWHVFIGTYSTCPSLRK